MYCLDSIITLSFIFLYGIYLVTCICMMWMFFFNFQCAENQELEEKITRLEQQLASITSEKSSPPSTPFPESPNQMNILMS